MKKIAKTAVIEDGAVLGENIEIGEFCVIGGNVKIGDGCKIYNNVTILGNTTLGKNNTIFPYAVLGTIPQDLKYKGEYVELIIGDDNLIREHCMFNPGTEGGGGKTILGNHNLFMAYVHMAHDCIVGDHCIFANNATLGGHVEIGNYVNFGGLSAAHQFVKVGDGAMLAAGSLLVQDLPPYCIAEGSRAAIRGLNRHRLRLLYSHQEVDEIARIYKRLFSKTDMITNLARKEMAEHPDHPHVHKICSFILNSGRGIPVKKASYES